MFRFLGGVHQFRYRSLHSKGKFSLFDSRDCLGITGLFKMRCIEGVAKVEQFAAPLSIDARRVGKIQHRVAR